MILGKLESGTITKGQTLTLMPNKVCIIWYTCIEALAYYFSKENVMII